MPELSPEDAKTLVEELFGRQEDLDDELLEYYEYNGVLGAPSIRHPLVYSIIHNDALNAMVNESLRRKKEGLQQAMREKNFRKFVYLHERPYRINAFSKISTRLGDARYWDLLGDIWTDTENFWQERDLWVAHLTASRQYRSKIMDENDRKALRLFPSEFQIWRGYHHPDGIDGLSWTTDRIVAKFFARRYAQSGDVPTVAQGTVRRRDVIGYFENRNESEIVVLPEHVHDITTEKISRRGKE